MPDFTTSAVTGLVEEGDEGKDYHDHYSLLGLSEKFTARLEEGVRTVCWYLEDSTDSQSWWWVGGAGKEEAHRIGGHSQ